MTRMLPARNVLLGASLSLCAFAAVAAGQEDVLLTVTAADGAQHDFDRAALEALPQVSFTTRTIWTEEPTTFTGPPLKAVLEQSGIAGGDVQLLALNDYAIDLKWTEIEEKAPIIATRINGAEFTVRDNGPLWVMYPFDSDIRYQDEIIYASSVWQLIAISAVTP
ncbi:oxidoreductase [Gemmobacter sp. LW-1]|jgi:hypothetical protein|uniref:oxidoreductase n=1 Tax=Gemmobacter sp. LW-1 TaxID=1529005 RepID=UPI0013791D12|nr:oxidoreductase [Gemmobacter sp. LW-1]